MRKFVLDVLVAILTVVGTLLILNWNEHRKFENYFNQQWPRTADARITARLEVVKKIIAVRHELEALEKDQWKLQKRINALPTNTALEITNRLAFEDRNKGLIDKINRVNNRFFNVCHAAWTAGFVDEMYLSGCRGAAGGTPF